MDTFLVAAPPAAVWALFQDIPLLSRCMPGAQDVVEAGQDAYRGKIVARVGAVKAAFEGLAMIVEREPNERLVATVQAQDRALASSVTATLTAMLAPAGAGTQVTYEVDLIIRGRLIQVGNTAVQQTAKRMTAEFAACLQASLTAP
jgi:carbon-monoxide dehydrogenase small subunit